MGDLVGFSGYDNRIVALGFSMVGRSHRSPVVSLDLSGPVAVVIGRNGSGKTRLLKSIGERADLIVDGPSLAGLMAWFTDLHGDPHWLHKSLHESGDNQESMLRQPIFLYDLATSYIDRVCREDESLFVGDRASFAVLKERLDQFSNVERAAVALVWTSFNFAHTEGYEQTEAYLLGVAVDLVSQGKLGVGLIGPDGRTRVTVWCRRDRDRLPRLAELETLVAVDHKDFHFDQIPVEWLPCGDLESGFEIDGPLSFFSCDVAVCLTGPGFGQGSYGPVDVSTAGMPLWAWHLDGGIMREWETEPLLFDALNVSLRSRQDFIDELCEGSRGRRSYRLNMPNISFESIVEDGNGVEHLHNPWLHAHETSDAGSNGFGVAIEAFAMRFVIAVNKLLSYLIPVNVELFLLDDRGELHWRAALKHRAIDAAVVHRAYGELPAGLPLEALSQAERRWAMFAIRFCERFFDRVIEALGTPDDQKWAKTVLQPAVAGLSPDLPGYLVLIDEPEAGLHRSAEPVLATRLAELARWSGAKVVVATHSPAFVREFSAIGGHVYRSHEGLDRNTVVDECRFVDLDSVADAIGLDPVHVLQLVRVFLCVEGEHDKAILEELFGEDLTRHGIYVVALRGALGLSQVAQSNVLWNVTDAEFVVVLDGIQPDQVQSILDDARRSYIEQSSPLAMAVLDRLDHEGVGPATERKAIRELFYEAVRTGRLHRIHVAGLPQRDILRYLDPRQLVSFQTSDVSEVSSELLWDNLHKDWRKDDRPPRLDFKNWLTSCYPGTSFDDSRLRRAVQRLDQVHPDLKALLAYLIDIADNTNLSPEPC